MTDNATTVLDRARVLADIAAALDVRPDDLTDETNLLDSGLDSVRLMSLIEKWRADGAQGADLVTLASEPVVGAWLDVIID